MERDHCEAAAWLQCLLGMHQSTSELVHLVVHVDAQCLEGLGSGIDLGVPPQSERYRLSHDGRELRRGRDRRDATSAQDASNDALCVVLFAILQMPSRVRPARSLRACTLSLSLVCLWRTCCSIASSCSCEAPFTTSAAVTSDGCETLRPSRHTLSILISCATYPFQSRFVSDTARHRWLCPVHAPTAHSLSLLNEKPRSPLSTCIDDYAALHSGTDQHPKSRDRVDARAVPCQGPSRCHRSRPWS